MIMRFSNFAASSSPSFIDKIWEGKNKKKGTQQGEGGGGEGPGDSGKQKTALMRRPKL